MLKAFSDYAYCDRCYHSMSVLLSLCVSDKCIGWNEMPFGTDTRMVLVTLYSSGAPVPLEREDMGWQSANRSQVVTDSGMVTKDSP